MYSCIPVRDVTRCMPAVPVPAGCRHAVSVEAQLVRGAERAHQKGRCVSRMRAALVVKSLLYLAVQSSTTKQSYSSADMSKTVVLIIITQSLKWIPDYKSRLLALYLSVVSA